MSEIDYIYIDNEPIRKPESFTPAREDVYAGEYTTCTGNTIADKIGWKYADMDLEWEALTQDEVDMLISMSGERTLKFDDPESDTQEETIIRSSVVALRHRYTQHGVTWWKNVTCSVRFINVHQ